MDTLDMQHLPALLRMTYTVLAAKVLVFVALFMVFGLFCWAIWMGTWLALTVAATFALIVFVPILLRCARKESSDVQEG